MWFNYPVSIKLCVLCTYVVNKNEIENEIENEKINLANQLTKRLTGFNLCVPYVVMNCQFDSPNTSD